MHIIITNIDNNNGYNHNAMNTYICNNLFNGNNNNNIDNINNLNIISIILIIHIQLISRIIILIIIITIKIIMIVFIIPKEYNITNHINNIGNSNIIY